MYGKTGVKVKAMVAIVICGQRLGSNDRTFALRLVKIARKLINSVPVSCRCRASGWWKEMHFFL